MPTSDPHGTERAVPTHPRFRIYNAGHNPNEEDGWKYQLAVVDRKYNDSDSLPIDARAGGNSWQEAFAQAGEMIDAALAATDCVF